MLDPENAKRILRSALRLSTVAAALLCGNVLAAPVQIVSAEFGVFDVSNPRETLFHPTRQVPHKVGTRYGWIIELNTRQHSVSVREEYLLPSTVKEASGPAAGVLVIPFERRNQVSQRQLVPVDGQILGEWEIGPGEPPGSRHLQVVVEGEVVANFEYEVK